MVLDVAVGAAAAHLGGLEARVLAVQVNAGLEEERYDDDWTAAPSVLSSDCKSNQILTEEDFQ